MTNKRLFLMIMALGFGFTLIACSTNDRKTGVDPKVVQDQGQEIAEGLGNNVNKADYNNSTNKSGTEENKTKESEDNYSAETQGAIAKQNHPKDKDDNTNHKQGTSPDSKQTTSPGTKTDNKATQPSNIKSNKTTAEQPEIKETQQLAEKKMTTTKIKDTNNFYGIEFTKDSDIFKRIKGKSYKDNCTVPVSDLRYLHILHTGFDGQTHEGEIVCNKYIAEDLLEIFEDLYEAQYQIEKVRLVDEYDADDERSMADNNSSSFNFRFISFTNKVSKHGYGLAMDINTLYNPYVKTVDGKLNIEPANAADYVDRTKDFPHKIDENDLAYKLFIAHGFEWGGAWNSSKDYQHFEMPDSVLKNIKATD